MNSIFAAQGFQRSNSFMGTPLPMRRPALGIKIDKVSRDQYLAKINAGTRKLATLRSWIAARIDADPMLQKTFKNDAVVIKNFWDFDDIVVKDQWYVDQASMALNKSDPSAWDLSDETMGRVDEWALVIDDMAQGMTMLSASPTGSVTSSNTISPTGGVLPAGLPASLTTPKSSGLTGKDLLIGSGIALGVGALLYALA